MASDENPLTKLVLLENLIFYFDLSTEELELMIEGLDELKLKIVKRRLDGDELCLVDYKNRLSGDSVERLARTVDHLEVGRKFYCHQPQAYLLEDQSFDLKAKVLFKYLHQSAQEDLQEFANSLTTSS